MNTVYEAKIESTPKIYRQKWIRSQEGWIAGVCEGLGQSFNVSPNLLRLVWLVSIFAFGTGLFFYFLLAITLPSEKNPHPEAPQMLGVCSRISQSSGLEVGLVRFLALLSAFSSFGITIIFYFILHLTLPSLQKN